MGSLMLSEDEVARIARLAESAAKRHRGGNSTVSRVKWDGIDVAVKDYSARADAGARITRESKALALLSASEAALAPQPLGFSMQLGIGVQSWLPGATADTTAETLDFMLHCMVALHALSNSPLAENALPAADAIASAADLSGQVHARLEALRHAQGGLAIQPQCDAIELAAGGLDVAKVDHPVMTLSPSDFGPHNIMTDRNSDRWWLIDLEFFGWDDAHKLVCDTLMHPLLDWSRINAETFVAAATDAYGLDEDRLWQLMPWTALKWGTIVLGRAARCFQAGNGQGAQEAFIAADRYRRLAIASLTARRNGFVALVSWEL